MIYNVIRKVKLFYIFNLFSSFCTQLVSLFLVYLLEPSEYGLLALMISVSQLMFIFTTGWTDPAMINLGTKKYIEKGTYKDIFYYRTLMVFVSFGIISILYLLLKDQISNFIRDSHYYYLVYILYLGVVFHGFSYQLLYPGKRNKIQSFIELITSISLFVITVLFIRSIKEYVYINTSIYFVSLIATVLIFYINFKQDEFAWDKSVFNMVFKFSIWQIFGVVGIYMVNIGINYVLSYYKIDVAQIGLYNFAYKLFSGFTPVFSICVIIIPQWIYSYNSKKNIVKVLNQKILLGIIGLIAIYIFLSFMLKPFIIFIGKKDYIDSVNYFLFLLPAFVFMCYGQFMDLIITTTPYFKHVQYSTFIQGLSLIVYSFFFISFFNIYGALFATIVAFMTKAIYLNILYNYRVKKYLIEKTIINSTCIYE